MIQDRIEISKRIKELRKKSKFSQSEVAKNLFISQAAYSPIENSQNGVVAEHIIKLSKLYDVTIYFILKGDKLLVRMSSSEGFMPLIRANAHAGFIENNGEDVTFEEHDWYRIPGFNPAQDPKLFEAEGGKHGFNYFTG